MTEAKFYVGGLIFFHADGSVGGYFTYEGEQYRVRGTYNPKKKEIVAEGDDISLKYDPDGGEAIVEGEPIPFSVVTVTLATGETAHGIRSPLPPRTNAPW